MDNITVLLLAAATVAEFVALLILFLRLRRLKQGGTFTPGKDCLKVTYYYLAEEEITGDLDRDLQNAERVEITFQIEEKEEMISSGEAYRKIRSMSPPPSNKRLIAVDVTIVRDCATNGKQ